LVFKPDSLFCLIIFCFKMIYSNGSIKKCYKKAVISLIFIKKYRIFATGNFMSMLWHSSDENPSIAWHDFF